MGGTVKRARRHRRTVRLALAAWLAIRTTRPMTAIREAAQDLASGQLERRVVVEGWTLEQFCLAPELRDIYSEFLWGFPLDRLDFIGITEFFPEDLRYFSREILRNKVRPHTLNQRPAAADAALQRQIAHLDRARVEAWHARDVALYRRALARRARRIGAPDEPGGAAL